MDDLPEKIGVYTVGAAGVVDFHFVFGDVLFYGDGVQLFLIFFRDSAAIVDGFGGDMMWFGTAGVFLGRICVSADKPPFTLIGPVGGLVKHQPELSQLVYVDAWSLKELGYQII